MPVVAGGAAVDGQMTFMCGDFQPRLLIFLSEAFVRAVTRLTFFVNLSLAVGDLVGFVA